MGEQCSSTIHLSGIWSHLVSSSTVTLATRCPSFMTTDQSKRICWCATNTWTKTSNLHDLEIFRVVEGNWRSYLSWRWPSSERWDWHQRCNRGQTCACARQSCGDGSRSGPCWAAGAHGRGLKRPASWGSPACRCLHWCAPHNPVGKGYRTIIRWTLQNVCFSGKQATAFIPSLN